MKIICVHHYGIIHSNFTTLKILYVPSIYPSLPPTPTNSGLFPGLNEIEKRLVILLSVSSPFLFYLTDKRTWYVI